MAYLPPYGQQLFKNLQAQIHLAPELLAANAQVQPGYTALDLQNLNQFLLGTPEQSMQQYAWQTPVFSNPQARGGRSGGSLLSGPGGLPFLPGGGDGGFPGLPGLPFGGGGGFPGLPGLPFGGGGGDLFGGLFGGDDKPKRRLITPGRWVPRGTTRLGPQRGFLSIYNEDIMPALQRARSGARAADIADVQELGPEMREALRVANPEAAALLDELFGQSELDLGLGATLNPSEYRNISQAIAAGQMERGMGYGPGDNFEQALASLDYGRGLQRERRAFAGNTLAQLEEFYGNPFERILARSDGNAGLGVAGAGLGASKQENLFNPESDYAGSIFNTIYNASLAKSIAAKNNQAAITAAGIGAAGNLLGGAMSFI
jgi:hypothetical protein